MCVITAMLGLRISARYDIYPASLIPNSNTPTFKWALSIFAKDRGSPYLLFLLPGLAYVLPTVLLNTSFSIYLVVVLPTLPVTPINIPSRCRSFLLYFANFNNPSEYGSPTTIIFCLYYSQLYGILLAMHSAQPRSNACLM